MSFIFQKSKKYQFDLKYLLYICGTEAEIDKRATDAQLTYFNHAGLTMTNQNKNIFKKHQLFFKKYKNNNLTNINVVSL